MDILIIIFVIALIIYGIFFAKTTKSKSKFPFTKSFIFDNQKDVEVNINEKVNVWNKPNTNEIRFYAKGYHGGGGLIGTSYNKRITNYINSNQLSIDCYVSDIKSHITIIDLNISKL